MIVAVTNCIAYGARIDQARLYRGRIHHSLLSDGLVRLFSGRGFRLAGNDSPEYAFEPIEPTEVDVLIWTPYIDQAGYYLRGQTEDGAPYPYCDTPLAASVGCAGRASLPDIYRRWRVLDGLTASIPQRILVDYPTDFLDATTLEHERFYARVVESNEVARAIFRSWHWLTVEAPVLADTWWAHLTYESRRPLLAAIEAACAAPRAHGPSQ